MRKPKSLRGGKALTKATRGEVDRFLSQVAAMPVGAARAGRLLFAMDATMSRQPSWDQALALQAEMFDVAADMGGLEVQLAWFRGLSEFRASDWVQDARGLARAMTGVQCRGGHTQIGRILAHGIGEAKGGGVSALVYIGDSMEENADSLCQQAGELRLLGVPVFIFQEGQDPSAKRVFQEIARLSGGAYCSFDSGSASVLKSLLRAVAAYAAGGRKALAEYGDREGGAALLLSHQIGR